MTPTNKHPDGEGAGFTGPRLILRAVVYERDGSTLEVIEQEIPNSRHELELAVRRSHFRWRFADALKSGRSIKFESRPALKKARGR